MKKKITQAEAKEITLLELRNLLDPKNYLMSEDTAKLLATFRNQCAMCEVFVRWPEDDEFECAGCPLGVPWDSQRDRPYPCASRSEFGIKINIEKLEKWKPWR